MKKIFLFTIIALVSLTACEDIEKLTQFDMEFNETVVIPSSAGINLPFNVFTPDVKSDSESKFAVNNTQKELVEEITLKKLELELLTPTNGDFGFLKSIEVYISADGLEEKKMAWKENIPSDIGKYLELEITDANLREYIIKDEIKLRLNTVTDELLTSDHSIDVHSVFFVDAKVLGF